MRKFSVAKQFEVNPQRSERVTTVMRMFGVGIDRLKDQQTTHSCEVEVKDGDIVYITGPSGAGKSVLLREMQAAVADDEKIIIEQIALPSDKAAIDCVGGSTELTTGGTGVIGALSLLSYAGLSDVFCMLNAPTNLSEGQKYRFRLACAMASGKKFIFADEFCSNLDRITAGVIAYNVRRFAKHNGVTFFLASAHEDILADLQPDVLVVKNFTGEAEVTYKSKK
ncbi:MAG: ABC transporter [Sedimentisphaerales bacterium]|jgi:ABC-type ATPase with predicted acetyltransferase domain